MSSNETAVSREIRETLKKLFPDLRFTRLQCGSVKVKGGFMRLSDPGWPDYIGYTPRGTFFGLEIKDPNGKTSKDRKDLQHARHADIQMCNGWAFEVSSVAEAIEKVQEMFRYEKELGGGAK